MIFAAALDEPTMFLMLTEEDVSSMRTGRTKFVDGRMTGNKKFDKVIVSMHADTEAALAVLRRAGHAEQIPAHLAPPNPVQGEEACSGCGALGATLLETKCILCWKEAAKKLQAESN